MASVTVTEILGSDSISGSRITINSNFLILQNWVNGFESTFGIDTSTGVLDLTGASTGRVSALTGRFNTISTPASGTALASINSSGGSSFVSVSTQNIAVSGPSTFSGAIGISGNLTQSAGATASFGGNVSYTGKQTWGNYASEVHNNNWSKNSTTLADGAPGLTAAFPVNTQLVGGGGIETSQTSPYVLRGTEDLIYANCGPTGFFMKVVDGDGATASSLPAGYRVTVVKTNGGTGSVVTGIRGTTSQYYTGFNTSSTYGGFNAIGVTFTGGPYKSAVTLQWEPRVAGDQATMKGSWVIIGGANFQS